MFPEFFLTSLPRVFFVRITFWLAVPPLTRLRSVDWRGVQREATSVMRRIFFSRPFETIFFQAFVKCRFLCFRSIQKVISSSIFFQCGRAKHGLPRMVPKAYTQKFDHIIDNRHSENRKPDYSGDTKKQNVHEAILH